MAAKERKYQLRGGVLIFYKGKEVTDHNLTDALAKKILAENPNRIGLFVKYPDNWETDIKPKTATKRKPKTATKRKPKTAEKPETKTDASK